MAQGGPPNAGHALVKAAFYQLIKYLFASVTFRISHHGHDFGCRFFWQTLGLPVRAKCSAGWKCSLPTPLLGARLLPALFPFRRFVSRKGSARETSALSRLGHPCCQLQTVTLSTSGEQCFTPAGDTLFLQASKD